MSESQGHILTIIKAKKRNNFTIISNEAVWDKGLTWEAKGLHTYLITRPDGWRVHKEELVKRSSGCGRDKMDRLVKELQEAGYITIITKRDKDGKFVGNKYLIKEHPSQEADIPLTGNQGLETSDWKPLTGDPPYIKKEVKRKSKKEEEERESAKNPSPKEISSSSDEDEDGFKRLTSPAEKKKMERLADVNKWNSHDFREYLINKFQQAYKTDSPEYKHKQQADGVIIGRIKKQLMEKFTRELDMGNADIREYILWVFGDISTNTTGKCADLKKKNGTVVTFGLLCSDSLISEWSVNRRSNNGFDGSTKEAKEADAYIAAQLAESEEN